MKAILSLLFTLIVYPVTAQNIISGYVTDKKTGEPLEFVNVYLPEHSKGTQTDINGYFQLKEPHAVSLKIQFSYIGYKTQIRTLHPDDDLTNVRIQLEPSVLMTQEVVVSGGSYSTQHENAVKIESVNATDVANAGTPSFMEALATIPGVDVIAKGPGISKPVIRGLSMTNILVLNNGVKMENYQFSENHPFLVDEFGAHRIEVIKGPASLLYGSDAVGGVLNILKERPAEVHTIQADYAAQYHSNTQGIVTNLGIKGRGESFFLGDKRWIEIKYGLHTGKRYCCPQYPV
ncbi:MAG TPA: hypothetical protein DEQ34_01330 [Balneolaceae bacterium]|nr:hypothetical protein [Balneolaceae bacterium]|tara:strand:+ start:98430 stop:99299 length:870 start_codon:yes stop_codon:yes gene_type:complete